MAYRWNAAPTGCTGALVLLVGLVMTSFAVTLSDFPVRLGADRSGLVFETRSPWRPARQPSSSTFLACCVIGAGPKTRGACVLCARTFSGASVTGGMAHIANASVVGRTTHLDTKTT